MPLFTQREFIRSMEVETHKSLLAHKFGPKEDCPFCLVGNHIHADDKGPWLTQMFGELVFESEGDMEYVLTCMLAVAIRMGASGAATEAEYQEAIRFKDLKEAGDSIN